eukprot:scaffold57.g4549.t1
MQFDSIDKFVRDDVFLELRQFVPSQNVYLKLEGFNAGGSIKLKTATALVRHAEMYCHLKTKRKFIESSSGNLGLSLSVIAAARGYHFTCVVDKNSSEQSIGIMRALGTTVVVIDKRDAQGGYLGSRLEYIRAVLARDLDQIWLNQYQNRANPEIHAELTAQSILDEFCQRASAVVILNDYQTGYPFACLEASQISAARTAASAVLAAHSLHGDGKRAASLGVIGAGVIARTILAYFEADGWQFDDVRVHDQSALHRDAFVRNVAATAPGPLRGVTLDDALDASIVVLATTAGTPWIAADRWWRADQLVLNVSLRDLAPETILRSNNVLDDIDHCMKANTSPHLALQRYGHHDFVNGTLAQVIEGESAGTDGVAICYTREQAVAAFATIIAQRDLFGQPNVRALCQAYLAGEEYVVNGVACDSRYFFTDLWHSRKRLCAGVPVYETQYLRYRNDAVFNELTAYTAAVCQALDIRNGPFHAEVMLTDRGPVLIEIGARIAGGADPYVTEQCLGHSQVGKLVQAVVRPDTYLREEQADSADYRDHCRAAYIYMISPYAGLVRATPETSFIAIDGVISVNYRYAHGDMQDRTHDLMSSPGVVIALGADAAQLDQTIAAVRAAEAAFYQTHLIPQA